MSARQAPALADRQFERIARALAEPRRIEILRQLGGSSHAVACSAIRDAHPISPATLSHHLKELESAGLIETARRGKFVDVSLRRDVLAAYLARLSSI